MDERVQKIYQRLQKREYRSLRNKEQAELSEACKSTQDLALRSAKRLTELVQAERAILFPEDRIGMMRTVKTCLSFCAIRKKRNTMLTTLCLTAHRYVTFPAIMRGRCVRDLTESAPAYAPS